MAWLVCMCKPNHEAIAATNLQRQGFTCYYPRFLKKRLGLDPVVRPLFPRYMFVMAENVWRSLTGTRGISYLLMGENGPHMIPDSIVDTIKNREDDKGLYQLIAPPRFRAGDKVKSKEGPLQGVPLLYEGMSGQDRVKVLAKLLGRSVVVTLEERTLVAA